MTAPHDVVIAIDGGNSKTDVLVVDAAGTVLGSSRGPGASPQNVGVEGCVTALEGLVIQALEAVGKATTQPFAVHTSAYLAGLDFPREEEALANDTLALLRAGTSDGIGVAVVCGAGINGVGIGPDGRETGFPALGKISGDWGGGYRLGEEALWWAIRAEDGRGPATALTDAVKTHYGASTVLEVVQGLHFEEIHSDSVHELCPLLFRVASAGDAVAQEVVDRFVEEVSLLVGVILRLLELTESAPEIVLGGGMLTGVSPPFIIDIERRCLKVAPKAVVKIVDVAPVVGAALFGLDTIGADEASKVRLRAANQRV